MWFAGFDLLVSVSALIGLWIYVRLATALFIKIRCPDLLGAVIAGVIIGQSGFDLSEVLVGQGLHFDILAKSAYWTGLIALMFVTGASLPRESDDKIAPAVTTLAGGTLIALILAFMTSGLISGSRYDAGISQTPQGVLAYQMILAIAAVVTSVPFLSKIFQNVGMLNTYFAKRILASACILDLMLWNLVPVAEVTRNASSLSIASAITSIALVTSFSILMIYCGPRVCKLVIDAGKSSIWRTIVVVVAFCGAVVGLGILFGVHPMIAALLAGYCVGHTRTSIREEFSIIEKFGSNNLVPLYFGIVGMSVHIVRDFNLGLILSFIIWSSVLKIACVFFSAKLYFGDRAQSLHYAVAMNTRGGPGIALAGLALSLGLIGQPTFLALIFASFITAGVTEAWLMKFYRRSLVIVPSTNNPPVW
jgi:Kef-type K+ transport system membrane component KefB